ncbi:hypothetical protein IMZ48_48610 [Candidatus Bathyarchaeota archaeon]|nr:hypothetical protein [Candidatus Bathyarchaeota archaeon]
MDSERAPKRLRTNTAQTAQPQPPTNEATAPAAPTAPASHSAAELGQMLSALKPAAHLRLLTAAATAHPSVAAKIATAHAQQLKRETTAHTKKLASEASVPISFDHYVDSVWHELEVKHDKKGERAQLTASYKVESAIEGMLDAIIDKTKLHSPFETKFSAIETFRQIFEAPFICCPGVIPKEVRNGHYGWGDKLIQVVRKFDAEELERLGGHEQWMDKLDELKKEARSYGIVDLRINDARDIILGGTGEAEGRDDEEEDEEEYEEDEFPVQYADEDLGRRARAEEDRYYLSVESCRRK